MIGHYLALIRREYWEHRSIWVTPAAIASVVVLGTIMALAFAGDFAEELSIAILGAQNIAGETERRAVLTGYFVGSSWLFLLGLSILTIFYTLDSLYAERKDKSILFWRSMPVTDTETVVSKLLTAIVLIPTVAIGAIIATHFVNLVITSFWVSAKGGDAGLLIWGSVPLIDNWLATAIAVYGMAIWMAPFLGWFLFVSAYTKRAPLLMAFLPLVLVPIVEGIFLRTANFADAVWGRSARIPLFSGIDVDQIFQGDYPVLDDQMVSLLARIDLGKFFSSIDTWIGLVVCGLLTAAAIYVRRYRDES